MEVGAKVGAKVGADPTGAYQLGEVGFAGLEVSDAAGREGEKVVLVALGVRDDLRTHTRSPISHERRGGRRGGHGARQDGRTFRW